MVKACDGLGTTHMAPGEVPEREEEDGEEGWWEAHRTSGVHVREGIQGKCGP